MNKKTKIWLIVAVCLVIVGFVMFGAVIADLGGDFTKLATTEYESTTYEIKESFGSIALDIDTADVTFALSADGKCVVECFEEKNDGHTVWVEADILHIERVEERELSDYIGQIGINLNSPRIKICLPQAQYDSLVVNGSTSDIEMSGDFAFGDVDIHMSTGDIRFSASVKNLLRIRVTTGDVALENASAGALELSVSTGDVVATGVNCQGDVTLGASTGDTILTDISCKNVVSSGNTGDITLKNVVVTENLSITRTTGDVMFKACDAAALFLETDTGEVAGSLLTGKVFYVETSTGDVDVPRGLTGGECRVKTNTGDVRITLY